MSILSESDIKSIARQMKIARLSHMPGMDKVAIALNSQPNYEEIQLIKKFILYTELAGYVIVQKPKDSSPEGA